MKIKGILVPQIDLMKINGENFPDLTFMMKCCLATKKCPNECKVCLYSVDNYRIFQKTVKKYWVKEIGD
jgi:hypothetical protein